MLGWEGPDRMVGIAWHASHSPSFELGPVAGEDSRRGHGTGHAGYREVLSANGSSAWFTTREGVEG